MSKIKRVFALVVFSALVLSVFAPMVSSGLSDWVKAKITGRAATQPVDLNISVGSRPPNVTVISAPTTLVLVSDSSKALVINFTAYDPDGSGNLKTTAVMNVTNGATTRTNTTCTQVGSFATYYANYTCTFSMQYYDAYGAWSVGVVMNDTSNSRGYNTTGTFSIDPLTAFKAGPGSLNFDQIFPGAVNSTPTNDPVVLNNTGNYPIVAGNLKVNATDLKGETDSNKALYAGNFTIALQGNDGTECNLTSPQMTKSTFATITGATLPVGNYSAGGGVAQEQLYACLRAAGTELSSQAYSTANQGAWTIQIE